MTPIAECYCLPIDALLTRSTIMDIVSSGHSRVPVYDGAPTNLVALLFIKDLAGSESPAYTYAPRLVSIRHASRLPPPGRPCPPP